MGRDNTNVSCDIRNAIELLNLDEYRNKRKKHRLVKCWFKNMCDREDKGKFEECG